MTIKANFRYRDYGSEISSAQLMFADIAAGGAGYDAALVDIADVEDAITACTLCEKAGYAYTAVHEVDPEAVPASEYAQRELGLRVFMKDDVNSRLSHFTIPGPDLANLTIHTGTDLVDLDDASIMAALVTEVEANCLSVDDNALTVLRAVIVGRKN
jgi:hypothetical protein